MCQTCWKSNGAQKLQPTKNVERANELFELVSQDGALHIFLGDHNIEDHNIKFCLQQDDITTEEKELAEIVLTWKFGFRNAWLGKMEGYF